jgi:S-adenosylmethionine-dependent methyltransferase
MLWEDKDLVARFTAHYDTIRGQVRTELVDRQIRTHLADPVANVIDIGGGEGRQALAWAPRGCWVTIAEPSHEMLTVARRTADQLPESERDQVSFLRATSAEAAAALPAHSFDLVMCHGVLMYLDEPDSLLRDLARLCRPGGTVSVLTKNAGALAMRPGLQRDWRTALASLGQSASVGWLGVTTRGDRAEELTEQMGRCGLAVSQWYGVGVFTDHDPDLGDLSPEDAQALMELEWQVSGLDPYRHVARLIHLVGHAEPVGAARVTAH